MISGIDMAGQGRCKVIRKDSFLGRTLIHLLVHGKSKCSEIRRGIGLDDYCYSSVYEDRSSYYFGGVIVPRLMSKSYIVRKSFGFYALTEKGRHIARILEGNTVMYNVKKHNKSMQQKKYRTLKMLRRMKVII